MRRRRTRTSAYIPLRFYVWYGLTLHRTLRDDEEDDEDEDDEEDDTAELLRELEKVKRERAEEKERQEREQSEKSQAEREAEIATANPLLNLAAALGQTPNGVNTTKPGTFAVKRRWDDGALSTFLFYGSDGAHLARFVTVRPHLQKPGDEYAGQGQGTSVRERFVEDRVPQVRVHVCCLPFTESYSRVL